MNLIEELKRRNVFRVVLAYLVLGWLVLQVMDVLVDALELPAVWSRAVIALLLLGLIPAVVFSWVYELTPEGLKKESEVDRSQSVAGQTGQKLNAAIVVLLVVAIGLFVYDRFFRAPAAPSPAAETAAVQASIGEGETRPSVAVLAFENMSADAENEYFADGISEEILNLLAEIRDLSVASRTSAFAFKGKDVPIPEIAEALKVRYVLEGSVRKAGEQVRVTAQLIDAQTDRHLWSETFDRTLRDVFTIQDQVAEAIGNALQVELLGEEGAQVRSESIDPEVYNLFLEARYLLRQRTLESINAGNRLLIDIVANEPRFARAHVLLGEAYLLGDEAYRQFVSRDLALQLANMHASLARSIDPKLGGIDMILGNIAGERGDLLTTLEHYQRSIELEPGEPRPYHWRGMVWTTLGFGERCAPDLEKALELDPENPNVHFALGGCLLVEGHYDRVIELAERGAQLGNSGGYSLTVMAEAQRGNHEEALQRLQTYIDEVGVDEGGWDTLRAIWEGERAIGDLTEEELAGMNLTQLLLLDDVEIPLSRLPGIRMDSRHFAHTWSKANAEFRADPRFIELMEHHGIPDVWRELGPPPGCRTLGETFTCAGSVGQVTASD
jgi:TolB-like protein